QVNVCDGRFTLLLENSYPKSFDNLSEVYLKVVAPFGSDLGSVLKQMFGNVGDFNTNGVTHIFEHILCERYLTDYYINIKNGATMEHTMTQEISCIDINQNINKYDPLKYLMRLKIKMMCPEFITKERVEEARSQVENEFNLKKNADWIENERMINALKIHSKTKCGFGCADDLDSNIERLIVLLKQISIFFLTQHPVFIIKSKYPDKVVKYCFEDAYQEHVDDCSLCRNLDFDKHQNLSREIFRKQKSPELFNFIYSQEPCFYKITSISKASDIMFVIQVGREENPYAYCLTQPNVVLKNLLYEKLHQIFPKSLDINDSNKKAIITLCHCDFKGDSSGSPNKSFDLYLEIGFKTDNPIFKSDLKAIDKLKNIVWNSFYNLKDEMNTTSLTPRVPYFNIDSLSCNCQDIIGHMKFLDEVDPSDFEKVLQSQTHNLISSTEYNDIYCVVATPIEISIKRDNLNISGSNSTLISDGSEIDLTHYYSNIDWKINKSLLKGHDSSYPKFVDLYTDLFSLSLDKKVSKIFGDRNGYRRTNIMPDIKLSLSQYAMLELGKVYNYNLIDNVMELENKGNIYDMIDVAMSVYSLLKTPYSKIIQRFNLDPSLVFAEREENNDECFMTDKATYLFKSKENQSQHREIFEHVFKYLFKSLNPANYIFFPYIGNSTAVLIDLKLSEQVDEFIKEHIYLFERAIFIFLRYIYRVDKRLGYDAICSIKTDDAFARILFTSSHKNYSKMPSSIVSLIKSLNSYLKQIEEITKSSFYCSLYNYNDNEIFKKPISIENANNLILRFCEVVRKTDYIFESDSVESLVVYYGCDSLIDYGLVSSDDYFI
ncbi:MAG: hypothetical protein MHPSP_000918, partial [Paramarteilia canceri]